MFDNNNEDATADFVIIGAGTAGCVLAGRLSENPRLRVVLIEAGPDDRNRWIDVPFGMRMLINDPAVNWRYETQPIATLGGRRLYQPRGKVVGGTGAINASMYVRGNHADFDEWSRLGGKGWAFADVLPFFKMAEDQERGADEYHGVSGPMRVSDGPGDPLSRVFLEAVRELSLPQTVDFNGLNQDGFGRFQTTTRGNRRESTARAYLDPARKRGNLRIVTGALVSRIRMDGNRAVGVEFKEHGAAHHIRAEKEVIVAGGAFNSPHLLELSGIGNGAHLRSSGLECLHHLPGVGTNLQEHFGAKVVYRIGHAGFSLNHVGRSLLRQALALAQYRTRRKGPLAWTNTFVGGFARSSESVPAPDIQITLNAWSALGTGQNALLPHPFPGITFNAYHLTPQSRGSVHAASPDPAALPEIHLAALDNSYDRSAMRAGVRLVRDIMAAKAFSNLGPAAVDPPPETRSDDEIDAFLQEKVISMYHPVGTCRLGTDDNAVVDPRLRVHGVAGLRIVDASVMPTIPRGNTNAATVMIAEKGSSMILADLDKR